MFGSIINVLKKNRIHLPAGLGLLMARIPYSWRPIVGKEYKRRLKQIHLFEQLSIDEKKESVFRQVYEIVAYSIDNIAFYREFYAKKGFSIDQLKSYDDLDKIPVVTKDDLIACDVSERSNLSLDKILVNTGGSTGKTLSFYIEPNAIGHEAAHALTMWQELGYKNSSLRLIVAGRSHVRNGVDYEFARNCYSLDMYQPYADNKNRLIKLLNRHGAEYLQGYPSALASFSDFCQENTDLLEAIRRRLKGVILNSEFPYPIYRDKIEAVFNVPTQAFYGHTERCIMAYEKKGCKNVYYPFQTYGFTEVLKREDGHYDLLGTCFFNHASPLIRYNTGDIVDAPLFENGLLKSFEIVEGRSGQFIVDKDGNKISLTGLIMGRHHHLFDFCEHIQIMQNAPGRATILYVLKDNITIDSPAELFDSSGVSITFDFLRIQSPILTKSGKVNLLVKDLPQTLNTL